MICKRAQDIISILSLVEHPEGGYYKETYKSEIKVFSPNSSAERSAVTEIYFLLCKGQVSRFHKVLHDEFWHFFEGSPLRLIDSDLNAYKEITLDPEKLNYQYCVQGGHWQAAESSGEYTLVGCTVAPGFDFRDFAFLNVDEAKKIKQDFEHLAKFI